jgi:hypothetical protein
VPVGTPDLHDEDGEYVALFLRLIAQEAEATLRDAEELRYHGFVPIFVRGSPTVIWLGVDGYFTAEAAMLEIEERNGE